MSATQQRSSPVAADVELRDTPPVERASTFHSFRVRNFRIYLYAQLVSQIGVWVQRIAQDWLVLDITGSTTDVGITTSLQFIPILLFGLLAAVVTDRYPKRWLMVCTQSMAGLMAAILAVLTLTHQVNIWEIYVVAFGLGVSTAFDNPVRQAFVHEMVGGSQLRNAVSLNASVFQLGALVGPLVSGGLISLIGNGWAFAINAMSYVVVIIALISIRESELHQGDHRADRSAKLMDGLRYVLSRRDILATTIMATAFAVFTANLPVILAAYAKNYFNSGAGGYGVLNSAVAVGAVIGAVLSARARSTKLRAQVGFGLLLALAGILCSALVVEWAFWIGLAIWGTITMLFFTTSSALVQLASTDGMRGRVVGTYMLTFWGAGAIGGPVVGFIAQHFSPRLSMLLTGAIPGVAVLIVGAWLARSGNLRLHYGRHPESFRYRISITSASQRPSHRAAGR